MKIYSLLLTAGITLLAQFVAQAQENVANTDLPTDVVSQAINNTPKEAVSRTPPMGWNSWNNFGLDITEAEFREQVDYVAENLKEFGYEYMTIDAGWYAPNLSADLSDSSCHRYQTKYETVVDEYGRWLPTPKRFPSASDGTFKALADYVHSKGLKFGLHIQRGIPWSALEQNTKIEGTNLRAADIANPADVCSWWDATVGVDMSLPGAQAYYNSCYALWASWGVDLVKVDDMSRPYHADEILAVRKAIENSGRNMLFSLSPGTTPITARYHAIHNADMFRISDDFWDRWSQLKKQFELASQWLKYQTPGHWADLDMLPVGTVGTRSGDAGTGRKSRLTETEQYTMMNLWAIFRSPLILGNDLQYTDDFTFDLITNQGMLEVNQKSINAKSVIQPPEDIVMIYSEEPGTQSKYLALFNLREDRAEVTLQPEQIGLMGSLEVVDLWSGSEVPTQNGNITQTLEPHASVLYKVSASR